MRWKDKCTRSRSHSQCNTRIDEGRQENDFLSSCCRHRPSRCREGGGREPARPGTSRSRSGGRGRPARAHEPGPGDLGAPVIGVDPEQLEGTADLEDEQVARVGAAQHGRPATASTGVGQRDEERGTGGVHERHAAHVDDQELAAKTDHSRGDLGELVALGQVQVAGDDQGRGRRGRGDLDHGGHLCPRCPVWGSGRRPGVSAGRL